MLQKCIDREVTSRRICGNRPRGNHRLAASTAIRLRTRRHQLNLDPIYMDHCGPKCWIRNRVMTRRTHLPEVHRNRQRIPFEDQIYVRRARLNPEQLIAHRAAHQPQTAIPLRPPQRGREVFQCLVNYRRHRDTILHPPPNT